MAFRTFALFSLFSWAAAVANLLVPRDYWSSIEDFRAPTEEIYRHSTVFRIQPTAASANTVLNDVTTFNSQVQTAITLIPTTMMSEEDAYNTYGAFLDSHDDIFYGLEALTEAESYLEPFGLVPTFCCLIQCITTGMHILVNETLAVTPEDYVSPIQTLTGSLFYEAGFVINSYC